MKQIDLKQNEDVNDINKEYVPKQTTNRNSNNKDNFFDVIKKEINTKILLIFKNKYIYN